MKGPVKTVRVEGELRARHLRVISTDTLTNGEPMFTDGRSSEGVRRFVIQKHDASRLHYDFRLELDGVLKSWAIPKGPSTNPSDKRLAIPVEDHTLSYGDFEGVIPEGQYGAGTVLVWDRGTYRNLRAEKEGDGASMRKALAEGRAEIWLEGEKLRGGFALVKMGGRKEWLLIKMKDAAADAARNILEAEPDSVMTGRSLEAIREEEG